MLRMFVFLQPYLPVADRQLFLFVFGDKVHCDIAQEL